jgi:hypothetical protein
MNANYLQIITLLNIMFCFSHHCYMQHKFPVSVQHFIKTCLHTYILFLASFFSWTVLFIAVSYLHFRNNSSSNIITLGLWNSNVEEQFEGQYFSLVTNIWKDLENKQDSGKLIASGSFFLFEIWWPLKYISFVAISVIMKNLAERKELNKELRNYLVKPLAKTSIFKSLECIYL